jgi:lipopolysaccharide transport system permease protein
MSAFRQVTHIRPSRGFSGPNFQELWRYRQLVLAFATRDVKLRYRQTALGVAWVVLQPLLGAVIFAMFSKVAKIPTSGVAPLAFSFASLLGWTVFQSTLTKSGNCLLGNAQLVSRVYFPRMVLPVSVVPGVLLDLAVSASVMVVILVLHRIAPTPALLAAPLFIAGLIVLALACGMVFSALSVSFRDIQYIVPVLVQFLFWASPIVLPARMFEGNLRWVVLANPITGYVEGLRWSLLGTPAPDPVALMLSFGSSIVAFVGGAIFFHRLERKFADVI